MDETPQYCSETFSEISKMQRSHIGRKQDDQRSSSSMESRSSVNALKWEKELSALILLAPLHQQKEMKGRMFFWSS